MTIRAVARPLGSIPSGAIIWALHLALPIGALWLLLAAPSLDVRWEDHFAHLWLIAGAAGVSVVLAATVGEAARRHGDARLTLIAMAFGAAAGFFAVHALVTPAVLVRGPNAAFLLSTPAGLVLAGAFALAASAELSPERAARVARLRLPIVAALLAGGIGWTAIAFVDGSPLAMPLGETDAVRWQQALAVLGLALFVPAVGLQARAYRQRPSVVLVSILTASVLLAEALVVIAFARSWHVSWWLWHVLLVAAFGYVAYSAHVAYRREGGATALFTALSLEETIDRIQEEHGAALEALVAAIDAEGTDVHAAVRRVARRFALTDGQTAVLERAATALAADRDLIRRLTALVAVARDGRVGLGERELLARAADHLSAAFHGDALRLAVVADGVARWAAGTEGEGEPVDDGWIRAAIERGDSIEEPGPPTRFVVPMLGREGAVGAVEVVRLGRAFSDRDRALLESLGSALAVLIENGRLYRRVDRLFRQFLPSEVAASYLADPRRAALGGRVGEVTVLFADLRGYTSYAEAHSPGDVVALLNAYFGAAAPVILEEGGTVVQFVGDALMAIWNAPVAQEDHVLRACRAALRMQGAIEPLAAATPGHPRFRIGVNTGSALVGTIGIEQHRDFTAVGDAVNVAARLQATAEVGTVVIGPATRAALGPVARVRSLGMLDLKGKSGPVEAWALTGLSAGARRRRGERPPDPGGWPASG